MRRWRNDQIAPGDSRRRADDAGSAFRPWDHHREMAVTTVEPTDRRIEALARELNVLGYFDDDDGDRPRAA